MNERAPLVSICCITYNHERYIKYALEGFLMQKTSFPFEILVHDDASTDNTAKVIREYEMRYPDIIKPIYQQENQFSKGVDFVNQFNFNRAQGKYVALCEGDDYWTDPLKLQKQVDFLEKHTDYSICGGVYQTIIGDNPDVVDVDWLVKAMKKYPHGRTITLDNYFYPYLLWLLTVCIRKSCLDKLSDFKYVKDDVYFAVALEQGKGYIFPDIFGVYRQHEGGIWTGASIEKKLRGNIKYITQLYNYYKNKSWCIRHGFYATNLSVLFYDLKEKNKFKVFFEMLRLTFSGKVRDFPFHVSFFVRMINIYAQSFFRKVLGMKPVNKVVEPH